ncbi:MAG: hypothetical protein KVP17_005015 [Porospora cf. gigantea B]|uniref:uncharacterized protein n=1 Tax=Porospora cf. gigantea B TaxID=2853592 RepID=UPI003571F4D2|nr:MAG: hypothetical protein KVP17_005015 [Porospora cf. gigantea B]
MGIMVVDASAHSYGVSAMGFGGPITPVKTHELGSNNDAQLLADFGKAWESMAQEDISGSDYYFNSYSHFGIHEEMLKDSVRTGAYRKAILDNSHLFKDKVVLDVGAGTGILSMFAAKAGAKKVIALECSEISELAERIIKDNGLSDKIVVVKGKAEEVDLSEIARELGETGEFVDIIVSEWMGYFLLYESMLDTVIFCRDKWLRQGGLLFPDRATLHVAAIEDGEYKREKLEFWDDVYGFDYGCMKRCVVEEPLVDTVEKTAMSTDSCCVLDIDLNTVTTDQLEFTSAFQIRAQRNDFVHALVVWFDCCFSACHRPLVFTTSPYGQYTHWKQSVLYLNNSLKIKAGESIAGVMCVRKNDRNPRDLDIKLHYDFKGEIMDDSETLYYRMR